MRRTLLIASLLVALSVSPAHARIIVDADATRFEPPHIPRIPHGLHLAGSKSAKKPTPLREPHSASQVHSRTYNTSGVEQWRPLVERYFGKNTDAALSVMRKESGGNPNAVNRSSGASGLFQQMPQYWDARIRRAEEVYGRKFSHDIFDPEANIAASAVLSKQGSDWSHWVAKP